jgi:hypothetical protein
MIGNRGQNTDSAKILEYIMYGLFFLYTGAPWLTRTYLSFAHTLDFVFEVLGPAPIHGSGLHALHGFANNPVRRTNKARDYYPVV